MGARAYAGPERRRFVNRSWPLPALLAWAAAWVVFAATSRLGAPTAAAFIAAGLFGAALSLVGATPWRRVFIGVGFPLSFAVSTAGSGPADGVPAWAWLLPLALLAVLYPWRTWRDAPLFPTRRGVLRGLAAEIALADGASVLDAGCGLGDALIELRREYPRARFSGIEWSWPLRIVAALRCRFATVRQGDMWQADWSAFDLVYLFQRPESMARAAAKAGRELHAGAWLASLEFEIDALRPTHVFPCADGRLLRLYRAPFVVGR